MHVARLSSVLKLRAVVPEDAELACQVFDAHDPDEPQDPDRLVHTVSAEGDRFPQTSQQVANAHSAKRNQLSE